MSHVPVYRTKHEDGKGGIKTIHRDHLLSIGDLVRVPTVLPARRVTSSKVQQKKERVPLENENRGPEKTDLSGSSSDSDYFAPRRNEAHCREVIRRGTDQIRSVR